MGPPKLSSLASIECTAAFYGYDDNDELGEDLRLGVGNMWRNRNAVVVDGEFRF